METDHSLLSGVEVNAWNFTVTSPSRLLWWCGGVLRFRDNFSRDAFCICVCMCVVYFRC